MSTAPESTQVELLHKPSEQLVPATLVRGMSAADADAIQAYWYPKLRDAKQQTVADFLQSNPFNEPAILARLSERDLEDAHWDWRDKYARYEPHPAYTSFVVTRDNCPQGAMYAMNGVTGRAPDNLGLAVYYIEFVAVAPWNRPHLNSGTRRYGGVGTVLITAAINESLDRGLGGRLALHSLPQSEDFYGYRIGMVNLGPDENKQGLIYFELDEASAREFMGLAPTAGG